MTGYGHIIWITPSRVEGVPWVPVIEEVFQNKAATSLHGALWNHRTVSKTVMQQRSNAYGVINHPAIGCF
jgi:hypothetical protein